MKFCALSLGETSYPTNEGEGYSALCFGELAGPQWVDGSLQKFGPGKGGGFLPATHLRLICLTQSYPVSTPA